MISIEHLIRLISIFSKTKWKKNHKYALILPRSFQFWHSLSQLEKAISLCVFSSLQSTFVCIFFSTYKCTLYSWKIIGFYIFSLFEDDCLINDGIGFLVELLIFSSEFWGALARDLLRPWRLCSTRHTGSNFDTISKR